MDAAQKTQPLAEAQAAEPTPLETAPAPVRRVAAAMDRAAVPYAFTRLDQPAFTAEEVGEALGVDPRMIAVATLMRGKTTKKPYLVFHAATTPLRDRFLGQMVGENLQRADDEFVLRFTGYPPRHVPPIGLANRAQVLMDIHLTPHARILFASGWVQGVFAAPTNVLARAIAARIVQFN